MDSARHVSIEGRACAYTESCAGSSACRDSIPSKPSYGLCRPWTRHQSGSERRAVTWPAWSSSLADSRAAFSFPTTGSIRPRSPIGPSRHSSIGRDTRTQNTGPRSKAEARAQRQPSRSNRTGWASHMGTRCLSARPGSYPVSGVSWFEAEAYCQAARKRLPTVYQWRRALRRNLLRGTRLALEL